MPIITRRRSKTYLTKIQNLRKKGVHQQTTARLSPETRERLYQELVPKRPAELTTSDQEPVPGCEGMTPDEIREWLEGRIDAYLTKQPWWCGNTKTADARGRAAQRKYDGRRGELAPSDQRTRVSDQRSLSPSDKRTVVSDQQEMDAA